MSVSFMFRYWNTQVEKSYAKTMKNIITNIFFSNLVDRMEGATDADKKRSDITLLAQKRNNEHVFWAEVRP